MQNRAFHFEIHDILTQFVAAFDGVVIGRYNKNRDEMSQIKVRYVISPKERVLFDIVNKAQNITLPVIAVNMTSITRDESRVFNKIYGFEVEGSNENTTLIGMPVPVNIGISMSIIASYQMDVDQILSNFVAYSNPYVIISWKVPADFNLAYTNELRSEVLWDGSLSLKYPTDTTASDKYRVEADTNFTIKGWIFPESSKDPISPVWFIDSSFHSNRTVSSYHFAGYETYFTLSGSNIVKTLSSYTDTVVDVISVSAAPTITNLYIQDNTGHYNDVNNGIIDSKQLDNTLLLLGKRFQYTTNVYLSSSSANTFAPIAVKDYEFYPTLSAYPLPLSSYQYITENIMHVNLPNNIVPGNIDIIVEDAAGWDSLNRQSISLRYIG